MSRDHFEYALIQSETTLQCNVVSHWLVAYTKRFVHIYMKTWVVASDHVGLPTVVIGILCQNIPSPATDPFLSAHYHTKSYHSPLELMPILDIVTRRSMWFIYAYSSLSILWHNHMILQMAVKYSWRQSIINQPNKSRTICEILQIYCISGYSQAIFLLSAQCHIGRPCIRVAWHPFLTSPLIWYAHLRMWVAARNGFGHDFQLTWIQEKRHVICRGSLSAHWHREIMKLVIQIHDCVHKVVRHLIIRFCKIWKPWTMGLKFRCGSKTPKPWGILLWYTVNRQQQDPTKHGLSVKFVDIYCKPVCPVHYPMPYWLYM